MSNPIKGVVAGGVATAALSVVMLIIGTTGFQPQLAPTHLLLALLDAPTEYTLGWILHSLSGSVLFGSLFTYIEPRLGADSHAKSGILYGLILWLVTMLIVMPAAGVGYFGFQLSVFAPLVALVLHVVYGAVLGWTYGKLSPTCDPFTTRHPA
jgi:uncharacterized membrane protein